MEVTEFIKSEWHKCVRENKQDEGDLIGLPYPFTVPCVSAKFQELYYWDTYFINRGLILMGDLEQAIYNVENMFFLIERYGFMPNASRTGFLNRTQPPLLSQMVKEIYDITGDKVWIKKAVTYLQKEYDYWDKNRNTEIELAQYKGNLPKEHFVGAGEGFIERLRACPKGISKEKLGIQNIIACESGWDCSPRFSFCAEDFVQVDLNSLLYGMENNIAYLLAELNMDNKIWVERYEKRSSLMNKYLNQNGVFLDYNFKTKRHSEVFSCASFFPLWMGLASDEDAKKTVEELYKLEYDYGLVACEKAPSMEGYALQWGYPNGWPPMHLIAIEGLLKYGFKEKALEIAQKYVILVEQNFRENGNIFEKYNVVEGNINIVQEAYGKMPAMLGWSAAVYLYAKAVLDS